MRHSVPSSTARLFPAAAGTLPAGWAYASAMRGFETLVGASGGCARTSSSSAESRAFWYHTWDPNGTCKTGDVRSAMMIQPSENQSTSKISRWTHRTCSWKTLRARSWAFVSHLKRGRPNLTLDKCRSFNPGRIDPTNAAWNSSRKPLVAHWQTKSGSKFYTINVHDASKSDGGSSVQGAPRPPMNSDVDQRTAQVQVIANFVKSLLNLDPLASVILAGDWNESIKTRSAFEALQRDPCASRGPRGHSHSREIHIRL
ncbi:hypothetical protein BC835DRAFT_279203 [Cytidiella melzeri]|nr:hypothetical protein BC835DRAFT_279203 [Cytidiella melzeri]